MIEFSASLASKELPVRVSSSQDVDTLMKAFSEALKPLNFWQYYVLDVAREKASVKAALSDNKIIPWDGLDVVAKSVVDLANILRSTDQVQGIGKLATRFGVRVDGGVAAGLVKAAFVNVADNDALVEAWARVVDVLNVPLYKEWEEDTTIALDQMKNRLTYIRLEEGGPKMGEISKTCVAIV
jgi:glycogen debranching enzyme